MTKKQDPTTFVCVRCGAPRGYRSDRGFLCRSCSATCPVCEERPRAQSAGRKTAAPYCNPCTNALQQAALCTVEGKEKLRRRMRERHIAGPLKELFRAAKARAKRKQLPFDLKPEFLTLPTHCPVLGIPLSVGTRQNKQNSFSLDRIIPEKGYVLGNVLVISHRANTLKMNATVEELEAVLNYLRATS